jgi:hypothetical protein
MTLATTCLAGTIGALNAGGKALHRLGFRLPSLDPEAMLAAAKQRTGLSDFGSWAFDEPLERLLESYRREASLTTLGRITVRELVVSLLENLLLMEADRKKNSAIERERIAAPTFIIGLPRTGTTLLHGLLAQDHENRVPLTWEVMYPAGYDPTPAEIEKIRARTKSRLAWANRLAPEFKRIHPIAPDLPQECIAITALVFMSIQFHTTHDVPSYEDWFERDAQRLAYAFHYRLLQHLQARRGATRWVLKAPGHLFALPALLEQYPDAKIIQTHRDPLRVMASMASHATVLRRAFSDAANPEQIATDWSARWGGALDNFLAERDRSRPEQFFDVSYEDIEQAPLATVERIYDYLGWPLTREARTAMEAYLAANPKNKHGVHRYSLSQFGLDWATEKARYADYCNRFDIPVAEA